MSKPNQVLFFAVARLLRPLVQMLLRNGIAFNAFADAAKKVYVDVASHEFTLPGRKQTISRVSILTGLSRKEVQRVARMKTSQDSGASERYHRAARVIAGWVRDRDFADAQGKPTPLRLEGPSGFGELVKRYSGDVPARAMLDELVRVGAVERLADSRVRLLTRAYVPHTSDADKLGILGTDVADLICTIDHNIQHGTSDPRFQRKVMYDNLPTEAISAIRALSAEKAQILLEELDRQFSHQDRDASPSTQGTGKVRAGVGIYYFEEHLQESGQEH